MCDILFVHPDLGIGGAERLVVDAALALSRKGHKVHILTSHHDKNHCFDETKNGTIPVTVFGDWLPRSVFGFGHALCAYLRMLYIAMNLLISTKFEPDVIICDLISIAIPVFKLKCSSVIYYCHFPDQLLSSPGGFLKRIYRYFIDFMEEITIALADKVFVNSKFTSDVFMKTFRRIANPPEILYPSLDIDKFNLNHYLAISELIEQGLPDDSSVFLSLNRFERKKNVPLCIRAFDLLRDKLPPEQWEKCFLIVAGGYDKNLQENVEHYLELEALVQSKKLNNKIILLRSPNDVSKMSLLKNSLCLIYTPSNEHFGIVPIEAMYLQTPVIAVSSGGPTETIVDGETGFLRDSNPEDFAHAMARLAVDRYLAKQLGSAGRKRVLSKFSFQNFANQLDTSINDIISSD